MHSAGRISIERFAALDRAARAGEYPNARTLAKMLEVSPRTVQRDIDFLRDRLGAPLAYDAVRHGYYYTDPTYRLPAVCLSEGELVAIFLAEQVLRQYRGTPYGPQLGRAFRKITAGLGEPVTVDLGPLGQSYSFRTTAAPGIDQVLFESLGSAIRSRRRMRMRYDSASRGRETVREIDPYHLASVDGAWYLVGLCHLRGEVRMFVPGRIRELEPTGNTFDVPTDFCIDEYLAGAFAVLRGVSGERYCVRLLFTGEAVSYVRERVWHPSQRVEELADGGLILSLEVSHLREVERWALSWGAACRVLEPVELRERIVAELTRAASAYADPDPVPTHAAIAPGDPPRIPDRADGSTQRAIHPPRISR